MNRNITGEDVLAGRFYLEMTQAELSVALGIVGITTVNRWENGHTKPSGAWAKHIDAYFAKKISENWRKRARTRRFQRLLEVRELASDIGRKLRIRPSEPAVALVSLRGKLLKEQRKQKRKRKGSK